MHSPDKSAFIDHGSDFQAHRDLFDQWAQKVIGLAKSNSVPSLTAGQTGGEVRLEFAGDTYAIRHTFLPNRASKLESFRLVDVPGPGITYAARKALLMDKAGNVGQSPQNLNDNIAKDPEFVLFYLLSA